MFLHEFQAKNLIAQHGLGVPMGQVASTPAEAEAAARALGCARYAVKAQVFAGKREAGRGVVFAASPKEVGQAAAQLIGKRLAAPAGGLPSEPVGKVYVEEAIERERDLYAAIMVDRSTGTLRALAASQGGGDIEDRVASNAHLVSGVTLTLAGGQPVGDYDGLAASVLPQGPAGALAVLLRIVAGMAVRFDATLIEINPLALTANGRLVALDCKMVVDDNALFRHPDLASLRRVNEEGAEDLVALEAQRHQINYLALDGDIGVAVNGAGLALATLDLIVDAGGRPANFMDVRTTATSLDIAHGFSLVLANPRTRVLLVNVHGGGMQRCDTVAEGLGIALRKSARRLPIVVRMAGNNAAFARTVLANNGVNYTEAADMAEAARLAVALARKEAA
jgi:succinyl-CoA synthetase beta subunit